MQITIVGTQKKLSLPESVFGIDAAPQLLAQAVRTELANRRIGGSHAKTRGEVSGGGKKPWRQKGTGRARVGSSRTPLWRGGGVIFGPNSEVNHRLSMSAKMRKHALRGALSLKLKNKKLLVIPEISLSKPSTKELMKIIADLGTTRTVLLVIEKQDQNLYLSSRNIPGVLTTPANQLSAYEVMRADTVVFTEGGVQSFAPETKTVTAKAPAKTKEKSDE